MSDVILAVSDTANFYPEMDDPEKYSGDTITWTFQLSKTQAVGPGIYELRFLRSLSDEEKMGNPVRFWRNPSSTPVGKPDGKFANGGLKNG